VGGAAVRSLVRGLFQAGGVAEGEEAEAGEQDGPGEEEVGGGEPAEEERSRTQAEGDPQEGQELPFGRGETAAVPAVGTAGEALGREGDPGPLVLFGPWSPRVRGVKKSPHHRLRTQVQRVVRQGRLGSRPLC